MTMTTGTDSVYEAIGGRAALAAADIRHSSASRVFPTPARPCMTRPLCSPEHRACSKTSSSARRPMSGHRGSVIVTAASMTVWPG